MSAGTVRHDAIIVGAGVAGGAAARFLTRAGRSALVIEATGWPRHRETCSGVFGRTFTALDARVADYPGELLELPVAKMRLVFGGKARGAFPERLVAPIYDETLYLTLRGELEQWILSLSSAELVTGAHLRPRELEWDGRLYSVRLPDGRVATAPYLIGAGGTHCPVRRRFFAEDRKRDDLVVLLESELPDARHGGFLTNYYFHAGVRGFGWVFPKGKDGRLANVGICTVGDPRRAPPLRPRWESFAARLQREGALDPAYDPARAVGSALYLAQPDGPVVANHGTCLVVGDAAGVAHRDFWNGITPSIESGRLAAEHVAGLRVYRRADISPFLFRLGRATPLKTRALDLLFRRALPRLSSFLETRR